jgi:hypothetical protein
LFDQPIHTLCDGTKVRLGIETKDVAANSAFVIYALVNGPHYECHGNDALGPLQIQVLGPRHNGKRGESKMARAAHDDDAVNKIKHLLFVGTISVRHPGKYEVWFLGPDRFVVAAITLDVTEPKAASPAWLTLGWPAAEVLQEQEKARADEREGEPVRAEVGLHRCTQAMPFFSGRFPTLTRPDRGKEIPLTQRLPRLLCDETEARLKLTATARTLHIESDTNLLLSYPREQFLFRLWVNDKLYQPKQVEKILEEAHKRLVCLGKRLDLDWNFVPEMVGAKKGDRVAVQVLYCPSGLQRLGEGRWRAESFAGRTVPRLPMLSPKSEFVVR